MNRPSVGGWGHQSQCSNLSVGNILACQVIHFIGRDSEPKRASFIVRMTLPVANRAMLGRVLYGWLDEPHKMLAQVHPMLGDMVHSTTSR